MVKRKKVLGFIPAVQSLAGIKSDTSNFKVSIVSHKQSEAMVYTILNIQLKPSNIYERDILLHMQV